jgi:hypothetical protein
LDAIAETGKYYNATRIPRPLCLGLAFSECIEYHVVPTIIIVFRPRSKAAIVRVVSEVVISSIKVEMALVPVCYGPIAEGYERVAPFRAYPNPSAAIATICGIGGVVTSAAHMTPHAIERVLLIPVFAIGDVDDFIPKTATGSARAGTQVTKPHYSFRPALTTAGE